MTIEEIQDKPYGEIYAALSGLAPQVHEAYERYKALAAEQRSYLFARLLIENGVRLGEKVRMRGYLAAGRTPLARVVGMSGSGELLFQVLRKDGQPSGRPQAAFMFEGFDKIE